MSNISVQSIQYLLGAGVHFGHKVSRGHPKMSEMIFGAREGIHIIDLAQSEQRLQEAAQAAYDLGKSGKVMITVGTKKQAKEIVQSLAKEAQAPFLTERWVGGILTNFDEIRKNIKKLNDLKSQQKKGELSRYTKREQLLIARKLEKFDKEMGGISEITEIPAALFIIDGVSDQIAVKEAKRMNVTVIGFSDTNADPNWFDFPIPSNDDGIKAIKIICETILHAYKQGKKDGGLLGTNEVADVKEAKVTKEPKVTKDQEVAKDAEAVEVPVLDAAVADEAAALEEIVEKKIVAESDRKV